MIAAASFALLAFLVSLLTTLVSLTQRARQLYLRLVELRRLQPAVDPQAEVVVEATEVGYVTARKPGRGPLDVAVTKIEPRGAASRVWTHPADWESATLVSQVNRAEGVVRTRALSLRPAFVSEDLLTTFDPRPAVRRCLFAHGLAGLGAVLWAAAALVLLATGPSELGAGLALACFLGMPLVEHRLALQARAPDEPGRTFQAEMHA